jgi:hypothetical protein
MIPHTTIKIAALSRQRETGKRQCNEGIVAVQYLQFR